MSDDKRQGPSFDAVFGTVVKVIFAVILIGFFFVVCSTLTCATCVSLPSALPERYDVTE